MFAPRRTLVNTLPLTGAIAKRSMVLAGYVPEESGSAVLDACRDAGLFQVMNIRIETGRGFTQPISVRPW